jgi:hypothetical protein
MLTCDRLGVRMLAVELVRSGAARHAGSTAVVAGAESALRDPLWGRS